jgi:tetratricopeptide (TPR) repeat protein
MLSCPGENTLRSVGMRALDDPTYVAIEQHVEECLTCKERVECLAHACADLPLVLPGLKQLPKIPGFEVHHELGRGAMGVVYLATQTGLGRLVALKVLPGAVGGDALPIARRRWLREARAVSSIRHPNVVPLFDYGEENGWFFLVLEYIPGGSFKKRLSEPLPARVAAGLLETIARAVGHIHSRGLLHLDLKPSNILLDCEENSVWDHVIPRVSDFGLALFDAPDSSETSLAGPRGTPSYMAPEQAAGSPIRIGPATDIYAMGAILFEILTGRPPFQGTSIIETFDQVRGQEPVPPRRLNAAISPDLETICLTCLRKEPGRRYASAGALADDLRRWLDGRPILARPVSSVEKGWRWCRRRPAVAALAASLALTLSAGFLTIFLLWRYADAKRIQAEAARIRAEADYEVGRAALGEILDLGQTSIEPTVVVTRDRVIVSLNAARRRILELANRRANDPLIWNLMAVVNLFLGRNLEYQGNYVQAESLYTESLACWEKILSRTPREFAAMHRHWQTLRCLGRVLELEGKMQDGERFWERCVTAGESVLTKMPPPEVSAMAACRMALARTVEGRGDQARARTILEANLSMLKNVPSAATIPTIAQRISETRGELLRIEFESEAVGELEWARRAVRLLHSSPNVEGKGARHEAEAGYLFQNSLIERAARQRRIHELDGARRTAHRTLAFARLLVSTHPDQSPAHVALSLAFTQIAKNAWQIDDRSAIERNWKLALEEARQALRLDPHDARAQREVTGLQRRLDELLAPHVEAATRDRTAGLAEER